MCKSPKVGGSAGVQNTDWLHLDAGRGCGGVGLYFLAFHACERELYHKVRPHPPVLGGGGGVQCSQVSDASHPQRPQGLEIQSISHTTCLSPVPPET